MGNCLKCTYSACLMWWGNINAISRDFGGLNDDKSVTFKNFGDFFVFIHCIIAGKFLKTVLSYLLAMKNGNPSKN